MDVELLRRSIAGGLPLRSLCAVTQRSRNAVRYWIRKLNLKPIRRLKLLDGVEKRLFEEAVVSNVSIAGVIRTLQLATVGSSYRLVRREIKRLGLSTIHWKGRGHGTTAQIRVPWNLILIENSPFPIGQKRKQKLIDEGILRNCCAICGMPPVWRGCALVLRLDHRNGIRNDHRPGNLRLVCPNCDSQLHTFCGRNRRLKLNGRAARL